MDSALANTSKQEDITQKLSKMTKDSSVLTPAVSITHLRDTASTGTVVHIPANAGTTAFNMSMFNQLMDFMQSSSSSKRKRDERNYPGIKMVSPNTPNQTFLMNTKQVIKRPEKAVQKQKSLV